MLEDIKSEKDNEKVILEQSSLNKKRVRHRKRLLYENILRQMEFYFSDANLSKDRYLSKMVSNDPYVPLETFLKCNAIIALTSSVGDLSKALRDSKFLELSSDGNSVRRTSPIEPYDADPRTVYVEGVPANADRDTLRRQFQQYGDVAYIALPKFKGSHRNKGYAFIEFGTPEQALKCLSEFTKSGFKLATDMPPEELASIQTFEEDCEGPPVKKVKKDKKHSNSASEETKPLLKNEKSEDQTDEDVIKDNKEDVAESKCEPNENSQDEVSGRSRKKKHRRGTENARKNKKDLKGLQVLSKSEWKRLRNRYLNLLRTRAKAPPVNNSLVIPAQPTPTTTHIRFDDDS